MIGYGDWPWRKHPDFAGNCSGPGFHAEKDESHQLALSISRALTALGTLDPSGPSVTLSRATESTASRRPQHGRDGRVKWRSGSKLAEVAHAGPAGSTYRAFRTDRDEGVFEYAQDALDMLAQPLRVPESIGRSHSVPRCCAGWHPSRHDRTWRPARRSFRCKKRRSRPRTSRRPGSPVGSVGGSG